MLVLVQDVTAISAPSPGTLLIKTYDVAARSKLSPKVSPLRNEPRDCLVVCRNEGGREPIYGCPERGFVGRAGANGGANCGNSAFAFGSQSII
jgi:hypothetical protein